MKNLSKVYIIATLLLPSLAFAATVGDLIGTFNTLIGQAIPVIIAFGFAYFLYGVVKFIMAASDDITGKAAAKQVMINGVIGLFVMVAVWGLVGVLQSTIFGGSSALTPAAPKPPR